MQGATTRSEGDRRRATSRATALGTALRVVAVVCFASALTSCSSVVVPPGAEPGASAKSATGGELDGPAFSATTIARLPSTLTGFTATESGEELLVADRRGLVWRLGRELVGGFVAPRLEPTAVLDVSDHVSLLGERGLLGLMLVDGDRSLVVNYTALDGTITVEQFPYTPGEPVAPDSGRKLLELPHPYAWHHGGDLDLDAEGNLYVSIGDMEFRQLDPPGPQDPDLFLGSILRVPASVLSDLDARWEASPDDLVAKGLRNPWRINFDPATGDLWIGDVGLDTVEEIDRLPARNLDTEVTNFGWPYFEGSRRHQGTPPADGRFVTPVVEHEQGDGVCGMVGGFIYRGDRVPQLRGRFVYGDLCSTEVRSFAISEDGDALDDRVVGELPETIVSFGEDSLGELYGLGVTGTLMRFDPVGWDAVANLQEPSDPGPTTTQVPRSRETCDGIVDAVLPLSELGSLDPSELREVMPQVNRDVEAQLPTLPDFLLEDALVVQAALDELTLRMEAAGWDQSAPEVQGAREEMLRGEGFFSAFPESMARIVDAECG